MSASSPVRFTDLAIRNLPLPAREQVTYEDANSPLRVRISAAGKITFLVFVGSGKRHTIGHYPEITLSQAREAAKRVKAEKTLGRVFPEVVSTAFARDTYLAQVTISPKTLDYYTRHLKRLKVAQVRDITPRDINRILDALPKPSRIQALASYRPFFKWCIRRGYLDRSPCELMVGGQSAERERVLSEDELKHIWREAGACGEFGAIVKVLMLSGQRRSEIGRLHSSWIKTNTFFFPKTKNKKVHLLPIGPVVASLLPKVKDGLLFPARGQTDRSFSGWSKSKTALDKRLGDAVQPWTLHDLRRTASTMWAEIGIPQHINDRLLNHISGGKQNRVSRIYNRYEYLAEKRVAIEQWEQRVLEIVAPEEIIVPEVQLAA